MTSKRKFVFFVQPVDNYGTKRVVAEIMYVAEDGLRGLSSISRWEEGYEFGDFRVSAYLGNNYGGPKDEIWGDNYGYEPHSVDLAKAEAMVKTLRKVEKGLSKIEAEEGYHGDFFGRLIRVARVLGVKEFHVRNEEETRRRTGEWSRKTDAMGVQYYLAELRRSLVVSA